MKGIKKCLLWALSLAMSATLFVACGGGGGNDGGNTETSSNIGGNGSESDSDVKLPDISVEVPDVEDIDGAPVANADEWNTIFHNSLSATNATIVITASENGTVMESGIAMIANGVVYDKWDNKDGTSSYNFFGEVDGKSYHWQSKDGKTWWADEVDWTPADYASVAYELEGMDKMLTFESATWNEETGMYTGDIAIGAYSLKISNGKVVYIAISAGSGMMAGVDCVYQIVYGQTADMTLPKLPTSETPDVPEFPDVDGEELKDEETWRTAWENTNKATNFTVRAEENYMGEKDVMILKAADGKSYMYGEYADGEREHIYYGEVDGKAYSWYSADGINWEVEEIFMDIAMVTTPAGFIRGIDQLVAFSDATYEKGYYLFSYEGINFRVKFAGGYVVEFMYAEPDGEGQSYKLSYGDVEGIELPELPKEEIITGDEIKDAGEWAEILENTDGQTNFTSTARGRMERDDGSISVMTEIVMVDNGKVYVETRSEVHSGTGSASGNGRRYYQGVVDGVAYQWNYTGDGYAVQQIPEVTDGRGIVQLLGLTDLDFAAATFEKEMGTYTFAADGGETISVRVVDGLIYYAELNAQQQNMLVEYKIVYGNTSVMLPPLSGEGGTINPDWPNPEQPDEDMLPLLTIDFDKTISEKIIGDEATSGDLRVAIKKLYASDNLVLKGHAYIEGGNTLFVSHVADGKMRSLTQATYKEESTDIYETSYMYQYAGDNANGEYYAWLSPDGKMWMCGPAEDVMMGAIYRNGRDIFGMYLDTFLAVDVAFKDGAFTFSDEESGASISVKMQSGEIKVITIQMDGEYMTYVIEYGNAEVGAFPPVTNGGNTGGGNMDKYPNGEQLTKEDWETYFENAINANNYESFKRLQQYNDDGKYMETISKTSSVDNALMLEVRRIVEDNAGGSKETPSRTLWFEDGQQYSFSYEKREWEETNQIMSFFDKREAEKDVLHKLIGAYDVMQWDEEIGYFYAPEYVYTFSDGSTLVYKDLRVRFENGYVAHVAFNMEGDGYRQEMVIEYFNYNGAYIENPFVGDDNGMGDNIDRPDIGDIIGGGENMDNNQTSDPSYTTSTGNNETDNGEEDFPENDKVIINNQYGY